MLYIELTFEKYKKDYKKLAFIKKVVDGDTIAREAELQWNEYKQEKENIRFQEEEEFNSLSSVQSKEMEEYAQELAQLNDFEIPKGEGVSGLVTKQVWDETGGNDPRFAPTSWDDYDLFWRMLQNGVKFIMPTRSVVWHFGARGSHRLEENNNRTSSRQSKHERINAQKFYEKWGGMPVMDQYGMICGIQ